MMKNVLFAMVIALGCATPCSAQQFVLFDEVFSFGIEEAVRTKSHLFVMPDDFGKGCPSDWTSPVDYRNGRVHIRIEVLEKPKGEAPTTWSLCYIPNVGQKNGYGCTGTAKYTREGVYDSEVSMTAFWNHDSIVWDKGIKKMALVIKDGSGGQGHAHKRKDHEKYFPTRIRISMVQIARGGKFDESILKHGDK